MVNNIHSKKNQIAPHDRQEIQLAFSLNNMGPRLFNSFNLEIWILLNYFHTFLSILVMRIWCYIKTIFLASWRFAWQFYWLCSEKLDFCHSWKYERLKYLYRCKLLLFTYWSTETRAQTNMIQSLLHVSRHLSSTTIL